MGATSRAHTSTVTYEKTCTDSSSRPTQSYQLLEYLQETKIHILEDEIQIQLSRNPGTPPQLLGFAGAICCLLYYRALTCFLQLFFFPMHRGSNTNSVICLNPVFLVKRRFYFIFSVNTEILIHRRRLPHTKVELLFSAQKTISDFRVLHHSPPTPWHFVESSFHLCSSVVVICFTTAAYVAKQHS